MTDNDTKVEIETRKKSFSWNPKNYLYLKEGRKLKLSHRALGYLAFAAVIWIGFNQFFFALKEEYREKVSPFVINPNDVSSQKAVELPNFTEAQEKRDAEEQRKRNRQSQMYPASVGRIAQITLGAKAIPSGTEVNAVLSSGGTNGTIKAKLIEPLSFNGDVFAEVGSILVGKGQSTDNRLYVAFRKLIHPDGKEIKIKAEAFDSSDRILGLIGKKVGNYAFKIAASSGLIFLSGYTSGLQRPQSNDPNFRRSNQDAMLEGVSQATLEHGRKMMDSMENEPIEVKSDTPILVIFNAGDENG